MIRYWFQRANVALFQYYQIHLITLTSREKRTEQKRTEQKRTERSIAVEAVYIAYRRDVPGPCSRGIDRGMDRGMIGGLMGG